MPGVFARLFQYRPRVDRSPREDFFTEALAGVLESEPTLCVEFMRRATNVATELVDVRVSTQETLGTGDRLDMLLDARDVTGQRHVVVLEHKIDASEGTNQLARYQCWLLAQPECTKTLAYVTRHDPSSFQPSPDVTFREIRWYEVFEWIDEWVDIQRTSKPHGTVLPTELLYLMEDWRMTLKLSAADLAAATLYKTGVEDCLNQILDEVSAHVTVEDRWPNRTASVLGSLRRQSPWLNAEETVFLECGFDFGRQDDDWHVSRLALPSAFVAARGAGGDQFQWGALPATWIEPPTSLGLTEGLRVRQISSPTLHGRSLHSLYLGFFQDALQEILQIAAPQ